MSHAKPCLPCPAVPARVGCLHGWVEPDAGGSQPPYWHVLQAYAEASDIFLRAQCGAPEALAARDVQH